MAKIRGLHSLQQVVDNTEQRRTSISTQSNWSPSGDKEYNEPKLRRRRSRDAKRISDSSLQYSLVDKSQLTAEIRFICWHIANVNKAYNQIEKTSQTVAMSPRKLSWERQRLSLEFEILINLYTRFNRLKAKKILFCLFMFQWTVKFDKN